MGLLTGILMGRLMDRRRSCLVYPARLSLKIFSQGTKLIETRCGLNYELYTLETLA